VSLSIENQRDYCEHGLPGPQPRDASGAAEPLTIRLAPAVRDALDALAAGHASSRSEVIADLVAAASVTGALSRFHDAAYDRPASRVADPPVVEETATRAPPRSKGRRQAQPRDACRHPKAVTRGKGPLMECPDCGMRGINLR
jgi:predicted transcriptional regulator